MLRTIVIDLGVAYAGQTIVGRLLNSDGTDPSIAIAAGAGGIFELSGGSEGVFGLTYNFTEGFQGFLQVGVSGSGTWIGHLAINPPASYLDDHVAGVTEVESLRRTGAMVCGKVSGARTGTETFLDWAESGASIVVQVDPSGNRIDVAFN